MTLLLDRRIGCLLGGDKEGFWARVSQQGDDMWLLQYAAPDYSITEPWDPLRFGDMGWSADGLMAYLSECGIRWLDGQEAALVYERFFAEIPD